MPKKRKKNKKINRHSNNREVKINPKDVEKVNEIINGAGEFLAQVLIMGQDNRDTSKENLGELLLTHQTALSVIWSIVKKSQSPGNTNESISDRLVLIGSFIQGIDICETAISSGLYTQATALLKQELETLAAIEEINSGKRMIRKTPNVSNVRWKLSEYYGFLNKISHVADKELLNPIYNGESYTTIEGAKPVSVLPTYNKELSIKLYSLQICLMIQLIGLMTSLYEEQYGKPIPIVEQLLVIDAVETLLRNGVIKELNQEDK